MTVLRSLILVVLLTGCIPVPAVAPTSTAATCHYVDQQLPDPTCTPGATDPRVTQENIHETICADGYTAKVRPSTSYTNRLKLSQMRAYGDVDNNGNLLSPSGFEEDHLISLELGGSPDDPRNLWPEPGASPNPKDRIENDLRAAVCAGTMTLADAQQRIAHDWRTAR